MARKQDEMEPLDRAPPTRSRKHTAHPPSWRRPSVAGIPNLGIPQEQDRGMSGMFRRGAETVTTPGEAHLAAMNGATPV